MTRVFSGGKTGLGAREGMAFGLSLLCAVSLLVAAAGPALAAAPGAPTGVSATAGNASATVTWTAPINDGGFAIVSYTVTASPGGQTATTPDGSTFSATVMGLMNGTSYTFTVTAHNVEPNDSAPSLSSTTVIPATVPGVPTVGTATAGNGSATVNWSAPADNGSPISSYTITTTGLFAPAPIHTGTVATTAVVGSLTNGSSYTFTVTAENSVGPGPASPASNPVTPALLPAVPAAPARPSASAGNSSVSITWLAPAANGSPIISYTITTPGPGAPAPVRTGTVATTATINGLTNGTSYTFTVAAQNGVGLGHDSPASNAVIPLTAPGAPTGVSAIAGDGSAHVSWSPPADTGGSPVTAYTVTARPLFGGAVPPITVDAPVTAITVAGLTNGSGYTFTVSATNGSGKGLPSTPSSIVTPAPDIPVTAASTRSGYWMVGADGRV